VEHSKKSVGVSRGGLTESNTGGGGGRGMFKRSREDITKSVYYG